MTLKLPGGESGVGLGDDRDDSMTTETRARDGGSGLIWLNFAPYRPSP